MNNGCVFTIFASQFLQRRPEQLNDLGQHQKLGKIEDFELTFDFIVAVRVIHNTESDCDIAQCHMRMQPNGFFKT